MNNRYKLLAEQARDWCINNAESFDTNAWQWERKFAELIVNDCISICNDIHYNWRFNDDDSTSGPRECAQTIKQHFEVDNDTSRT